MDNNFENLTNEVEHALDGLTENIKELSKLYGDEEAKISFILKQIKHFTETIMTSVEDYKPSDGRVTCADLRNERVLDYPKREL